MSEEWRIEHRNHLLAIDGCPYCFKRLAMDEEPTKIGTWCMIHSAFDCAEPDCYVCGNHQLDEFAHCSAPTCRSWNGPEAIEMVAAVRQDWDRYGPGGPAPRELLAFFVGLKLQDKLRRTIADAQGAAREAGLEEPVAVTPAPAPREGGYG